MNIFIAGADTDAGKTTVASWICSKTGAPYWKLIQTGDTSDSENVRKFSPNSKIFPEVYKFLAPLSAYDAAKKQNQAIDSFKFKINTAKTVIEGSGGVFVPIAENFLMIDAIKFTNSQVIVVARSKLGMINHILLTISALKSRFIPILGIIVCGDLDKDVINTIQIIYK